MKTNEEILDLVNSAGDALAELLVELQRYSNKSWAKEAARSVRLSIDQLEDAETVIMEAE
ncbi:hypothetical protein CPT_Marzo_266 [Stenotrophomonas phage Marzo]|nr:hypothetical protein CPT_Marzo_266 [Stenotrophomonas phage Marzo]